jgi:phenylalanyl-tRNA synthetase beta chain
MLELGHPLHAFDADTIAGDRLVVRRASEGETLVTLDDVVRELTPDDLIIYDADGPTSMSGTMGGARSEVSQTTVSVLMEAASWDPPTIMYMSRRHGLMSEASGRFERGVDPNLTDMADARAAAMVVQLAGGEVLDGVIDEIATPIEPLTVELTLGYVERILGPGFTSDEVGGIIRSLGMDVSGSDPLMVTVPTYRPDITRPIDLIEEVARIHGFDRFPATLPLGGAGGFTAEQRRLRTLKNALVGIGMFEAVTLPFVTAEDLAGFGWTDTDRLLHVANPLREEEGTMRPTLLPGLLDSARFNLSRGASSVAVFEAARAFTGDASQADARLPHQVDRLSWVLTGDTGPTAIGVAPFRADSFVAFSILRHVLMVLGHRDFTLKPQGAPGFHPGRTAEVVLDGDAIGHVGELTPAATRYFELPERTAIAELDLARLLAPVPLAQAVSPSPFPHVDFDLSFVVPDDLPVADLIAATTAAGEGLLESARVFDVFRGPGVESGHRAVAIRYRLRASDHTLTNEEVAPVRTAMIASAKSLGAGLRGA